MIDGVETLWIDAPQPFTAVLSFRVGVYDETVIDRGLTHLVEHLVVERVRNADVDFNAETGGRSVSIMAAGRADDVAEFLRGVCEAIWVAHESDIEREVLVLSEEARSQPRIPGQQIANRYFGLQGPGLGGCVEMGLTWIDEDDVRAWARRYFTKGNAVLALTGPPPPGMSLPAPDGKRIEVPAIRDEFGLRVDRPTRIGGDLSGIATGCVAPRSHALALGTEIVVDRLRERLRHELGAVYNVSCGYEAVDESRAFIQFMTACAPENAVRVGDEFVATIEGIVQDGPNADELARARRAMLQPDTWNEDSLTRAELMRTATDRLLGCEHESLEALIVERTAVGCDEIRVALAAAWRGTLILCADGVQGVAPETCEDEGPITGNMHRQRASPSASDCLILAGDGFAARHDLGWSQYRFAEIAMLDRAGPGERVLVFSSGTVISIRADDWTQGRLIIDAIDEAVRADRVLVRKRDLPGWGEELEPAKPTLLERLKSLFRSFF